MPIHQGSDRKGTFYQWGNRTKYYYDKNSTHSEKSAYNKAKKQMEAIFASGYKPRS